MLLCNTLRGIRRRSPDKPGTALLDEVGIENRPTADGCGGLWQPYRYGTIVWMKKTLHIDEHLLREARTASGAKTDTDAVRLGLEALVRRAAYQRLSALRGSEPRARDVARRRERTTSARHSVT